MAKTNLLGYSVAELEELMVDFDCQRFKGRQLYKWLYQSGQYDFNRMTDLKLELREKLSENYIFDIPRVVKISQSSDGTEKYLLSLDDSKLIETVMIPDGDNRTLCLSTQTGCGLACRFCATGTMGSGRNLTAGEIIGQLLMVKERFPENPFTNIVFMGMGEPLLNLDELFKSIEIITSPIGLALPVRKITISTVGITPGIYRLADSEFKTNLAVSLHAPNESKRLQIMPIAKSYPLDNLLKAVRYYCENSGKRVTFEYILFKGLNDSKDDARELSRLTKGIPCKINILAYNPIEGLDYGRPTDDEINEFGRMLNSFATTVTVRKSRGLDIDAACGQLAGKNKD